MLNTLAAQLNKAGWGIDILHSEPSETNLWAGLTTNNYDGYLDIYDPSANPGAAWSNPAPSGSWKQAQRDHNNTLPEFPGLKNIQGVLSAGIRGRVSLWDPETGSVENNGRHAAEDGIPIHIPAESARFVVIE